MSRPRFELDMVQVMAAVLAAVTGAILASDLGVAGTIAGTAVASFVGTAGTAIYRHYLGRTRERLRGVVPVVVRRVRVRGGTGRVDPADVAALPSADGVNGQVAGPDAPTRALPAWPASASSRGSDAPTVRQRDEGMTAASSGSRRESPTEVIRPWTAVSGRPPGDRTGASPRRGAMARDARRSPMRRGLAGPGRRGPRRWLAVSGVAVGAFLLVMAAITVFEVGFGKPLDAAVWGHRGSGTTLGDLVGGGRSGSGATQAPTTSPAPTGAPSPSGSSSPAGSPPPASTSGSPSPTVSPTTSAPARPTASPSPDPSPSTTVRQRAQATRGQSGGVAAGTGTVAPNG